MEHVAQFARLLNQYADVFIKGEGDIGRTELIRHSISVKPATKPIRIPPHRLGPHKSWKQNARYRHSWNKD